ncbi:MAG: 16S rRNA (guanine(527)-N(7))-methyltransferase RsmG [Bifidobacteriaceae bacterium]|jgi:16S rRNA (guanine527-N7)-methyltransferase|nr:16S rRNA (guanine(527)-N(7))-methyltransferase RsmG [Bifidobacteriaceae bacterium]
MGGSKGAEDSGIDWDQCRELFAQGWGTVVRFADLLRTLGVERGLIGPKEGPRLWSRHLVNCAALVPLLPDGATVIDVGSGAGLPGVVIAAVRLDLAVELVEPMERRVGWLREVVETLGLENVTVTRARAEELAGGRRVDAVVARAVAPLGRLAAWSAPLLGVDGQLLALKGRRVRAEVESAQVELHRCGLGDADVMELRPLRSVEPTYVARARVVHVSRETRGVDVGGTRYDRPTVPTRR